MTTFSLGLAAPPGTGTFRALFWKELREGFKWGVLGTLIVAANVLAAVDSLGPTEMLPSGMMILAPALVALLLGLTQTIPENRGDAWGFQVHRPVRRSTLFSAKVFAGLLLYSTATLAPFLAGLSWFATPGHRAAPFDWTMALPGIAYILCGMVYYFAALVVGMHDARWFGSRALAFGTGLTCSYLVVASTTFLGAVTASTVGILIAAVAARGVFVAGGRVASQGNITRAALGVNVTAGLSVASVLATWILLSTLPSDARVQFATYAIAQDGTIATIGRNNGQGTLVVNGLDGRGLGTRSMVGAGVAEADLRLTPAPASGYQDPTSAFVALGGQDQRAWFFSRRAGLIAGYDLRSRRLFGWLGPAGFTPAPSVPSQRFTGPLESSTEPGSPVLAFPDAVYHVTFASRSVERIFTPPAGESVLDAGESGDEPGMFSTADSVDSVTVVPFDPGESSRSAWRGVRGGRFYAIATTEHVFVLPRIGKPASLAVARDSRATGYRGISILRPVVAQGQPTFLLYQSDPDQSPLTVALRPPLIIEYHDPDSVIARVTLPLLKPTGGVPWTRVMVSSLMAPPALRLWHPSGGTGTELQAPTDPLLNEDFQSPAQHGAEWAVAILLSLCSVVAALAIGRRAGFSRSRLCLWAVLAAGMGAYGVLLMLSLNERPARVSCPVCGLGRAVTHERCEHCGGAFARPARDGTEIFEPMLA